MCLNRLHLRRGMLGGEASCKSQRRREASTSCVSSMRCLRRLFLGIVFTLVSYTALSSSLDACRCASTYMPFVYSRQRARAAEYIRWSTTNVTYSSVESHGVQLWFVRSSKSASPFSWRKTLLCRTSVEKPARNAYRTSRVLKARARTERNTTTARKTSNTCVPSFFAVDGVAPHADSCIRYYLGPASPIWAGQRNSFYITFVRDYSEGRFFAPMANIRQRDLLPLPIGAALLSYLNGDISSPTPTPRRRFRRQAKGWRWLDDGIRPLHELLVWIRMLRVVVYQRRSVKPCGTLGGTVWSVISTSNLQTITRPQRLFENEVPVRVCDRVYRDACQLCSGSNAAAEGLLWCC